MLMAAHLAELVLSQHLELRAGLKYESLAVLVETVHFAVAPNGEATKPRRAKACFIAQDYHLSIPLLV